MIEIKQAESSEERQQCFALRHEVFVVEQGVPVEMELDEHDEMDALHMIGLEDGVIVATARMVVISKVGKIGRVAVAQGERGKGYGKRIIEALIDYARTSGGVKSLTLDAQIQATGLYGKLGFAKTGEVFDDAGIDHIKMVRKV